MKLLVVDDDRVTRDLIREIFEAEGFEVSLAPSGEAAITMLGKDSFQVVLSDIRMVELDGLALLAHIKKFHPQTVVILMTGFGNMEGAIRAIQQGAFDYVSKPFKILELKAIVARAARHWKQSQEPQHQSRTAATPPKLKTLIGKSSQIMEVYKTLARATLSPSNILIVGESGTGKELVARAIHENSARRSGPFVAVNCGALSENLLESELFGHVKGSFTGAIHNKTGLFEEANGGTLFLDEIGDIPPSLQVKLLRVIQEGEFKPVGSTENRQCDVRMIAATHRDLQQEVEKGNFREDLYYRLKVVLIQLPPLRERREDIIELVTHFCGRFSEKIGRPAARVSEDAMKLLMSYTWPGNVRELEHAIERAVTMARSTVIYPEDLPPEIQIASRDKLVSPSIGDPSTTLEEVEKAHILQVLEASGWNKSKAASILGIDRKTLHRKAQRYRITLK